MIKLINPWLYKACKDILDYHFFIKYMRGGEGTRKKYKLQKRSINERKYKNEKI